MSLSAGRNTPRREFVTSQPVVKSGSTVYAGGMVTLLTADGTAVPAGTASAGAVIGVAEETVKGDGTVTARVRAGTFRFGNSTSTDAIAAKNIGAACYIVDDETVALTDNSGARKKAGVIVDVDDNGVWVSMSPEIAATL